MDPSLTGTETALVVAHLVATWFLVGLIWIVQRVTYPAFRHADGDGRAYHRHHTAAIGPIVGPPMAIEAITAAALVWPGVPGVPGALAGAGLVLLAVVTASTALVQVPAHGRLAQGMTPEEVDRIVRTNWVRTIGWSLRGVIAVAVLLSAGA